MGVSLDKILKFYKPDAGDRIRILDKPPVHQFFTEEAARRLRLAFDYPPATVVVPEYKTAEPRLTESGKSYYVNALVPVVPEKWHTVQHPKRHTKRSNQREAYHRRVQKKWTKRGLTVATAERVMKPAVLRLPLSVMYKIRKLIGTRDAQTINGDLHLDLERLGALSHKRNKLKD